jgi:hypothetical protein
MHEYKLVPTFDKVPLFNVTHVSREPFHGLPCYSSSIERKASVELVIVRAIRLNGDQYLWVFGPRGPSAHIGVVSLYDKYLCHCHGSGYSSATSFDAHQSSFSIGLRHSRDWMHGASVSLVRMDPCSAHLRLWLSSLDKGVTAFTCHNSCTHQQQDRSFAKRFTQQWHSAGVPRSPLLSRYRACPAEHPHSQQHGQLDMVVQEDNPTQL